MIITQRKTSGICILYPPTIAKLTYLKPLSNFFMKKNVTSTSPIKTTFTRHHPSYLSTLKYQRYFFDQLQPIIETIIHHQDVFYDT